VLVFDDCDSILLDDVALNLLKGALDSGKKRKISWLSESSALRREGIPDSFEFKGSVIFITNLKFDQMKSQKLRDHLDALQSRCHYLDLTLDTMRDKILRIKQIANDGVLFQDYEFSDMQQDDIIDFMNKNEGTEIARTEVTKALVAYIKENKLENEKNSKIIKPDNKLKILLELEDGQELTYFNIQKYMNKHFYSKKDTILTAEPDLTPELILNP
jgi:hypothetical protein